MKRTFLLIALLSFIQFNRAYAQSGWFWLNPLPQGNTLQNVICVNQNTIYAGGYDGTLIKSNNSGLNWTIVLPNSTYIYGPFSFVNEFSGFALGRNFLLPGNGVILRTNDGGISWVNLSYDSTKTFFCIHFPNINTGYCAGFGGTIFKTTNSGNTWNNISINNTYAIRSIYFLDGNTGYAAGYTTDYDKRLIMRTTNGGLNWEIQIGENYRTIYRINFLNYNTGFAISDYYIYKTTNSGIQWHVQDSVANSAFRFLKFVNNSTGYAVSLNYTGITKIFITTNEGTSWDNYNSNMPGNITSLDFGNLNTFFAVESSKIYKTSNSGYNWSYNVPITTETLNQVYFMDSNLGYIVGSRGIILKTSNSGYNWFNISLDSSNNFYTIFFSDLNNGYVAGYTGIYPILYPRLFKTTNAGSNWTLLTSNTIFSSIYFNNNNTGYGCGTNYIQKTTDGGLTWSDQLYSTNRFYKIQFLNDNTGYVCGGENTIYPINGILLKTTNGGNNWINISYYSGKFLRDLYFFNTNTGFIAQKIDNFGSYISKTTDGGNTWNYAPISNLNVLSIHFSDPSSGFAVGVAGKYFKSTDGGTTWVSPYIITSSKDFQSILFTSINTGFIVGSSGTILKTTTGGNIVGIQPINNKILKSFLLYQNYPNPFNPATKIRFSLPNPSEGGAYNVKLIIYDILGREVITLINEHLSVGVYEAEWNASDYPSGVYFYRLTAGDYSETKKMVLIK